MQGPGGSLRIQQCAEALNRFGIPAADKLIRYMDLLLDWNEKINVTGAKNPAELALKHIADVFGAWSALKGLQKPVFDIGSGGGLPGLVLAILSPQVPVYLIERRIKKANVVEKIAAALDLGDQVKVVGRPFEEIRPLPRDAEYWFRGFLPGEKLARYFSDHFRENELARLILMKGPAWSRELDAIAVMKGLKREWKERFLSSSAMSYELPENAGSRVLVLI